MKRRLFSLLILLCTAAGNRTPAQTFPVDTLQYNGDPAKYINLVILGDGFTLAEQPLFTGHAALVVTNMFSQQPWAAYKNYFNIFAIRTVSVASGIAHPSNAPDCPGGMPAATSNSIFGTKFDVGGIHRLVAPTNYAAVASVLAANFPAYDQVLILANSTWYGGSGGGYSTATMSSGSLDVALHEMGHSFGHLTDEYWYIGGESANCTAQSSPALVKWSAWVGTSGVGVFQHCCGGASVNWYKPHQSCKMSALGQAFCPVCIEALVEKIHAATTPIVRYHPANTATLPSAAGPMWFALREVMKPIPNTLRTAWVLDGAAIGQNPDSVSINGATLLPGTHTLAVSATDTTTMLRVAGHSSLHTATVTWTIQKSATGISLQSAANEVSLALSPNPARDQLIVSIATRTAADVRLDILAVDGRAVRSMAVGKVSKDAQVPVDVRGLPPGTYLLRAYVGGQPYSLKWVHE